MILPEDWPYYELIIDAAVTHLKQARAIDAKSPSAVRRLLRALSGALFPYLGKLELLNSRLNQEGRPLDDMELETAVLAPDDQRGPFTAPHLAHMQFRSAFIPFNAPNLTELLMHIKKDDGTIMSQLIDSICE